MKINRLFQQCETLKSKFKNKLGNLLNLKKSLVDLARLFGLSKIITGKGFFSTNMSQKLKQLENAVTDFALATPVINR